MTHRPWRWAWHDALYGKQGFYLTQAPANHFRTSAHAGPVFARAIAGLAARHGLTNIVDVGAGSGELLTALHGLDPGLNLHGIELRERPAALPAAIAWSDAAPDQIDGLVVANELLDNIPCDVVEVDPSGVARHVEVDPDTGTERLAWPLAAEERAWCEAWWPLLEPGQRAELGLARDAAWSSICERTNGVAVAIDYGHLRADRPRRGSLAAYRAGRQVGLDSLHGRDITAHVAVDAVASAAGGRLQRQADALADLGVEAPHIPLAEAGDDPAAHARSVAQAASATTLTARGGLGDFWWVRSD